MPCGSRLDHRCCGTFIREEQHVFVIVAQVACQGCCHAVDRRRFLQGCGLAATAAVGPWTLSGRASAAAGEDKVRVAAVFLADINVHEIWPYPGFDTEARQREILAALREGCPEIEFVPLTVVKPDDVQQAIALRDKVDGYLVYTMTLAWGLTRPLVEIGQLGKPTLVADEYLGGSGVFLTGYSQLCTRQLPAAAVSTTRLADLVAVARQFADVRRPGTTPASFAQQCEKVYRETFAAASGAKCQDDPLSLTGIGECLSRFRESRFLIVGGGRAGQEQEFLGAKGIYLDFDELQALYEKADQDQAADLGGDLVEAGRPRDGATSRGDSEGGRRVPGHEGAAEKVRHGLGHHELPGRFCGRQTARLSVPGVHADSERRRPGRV